MKITIDEKLTSIYGAKKVREDIKLFKATYTANDILNQYNEQIKDGFGLYGDVLVCDVRAFENTIPEARTEFAICLWVANSCEVFKLRFYADMGLNITNDALLIDEDKYERVRK